VSSTVSPAQRICNLVPSKGIEKDWGYHVAVASGALSAAAALPSSVDLRAAWWAIDDQEDTGSCVGWATAEGVVRYHMVKASRLARNVQLSRRFVWMASKETDELTTRPETFIEGAGTSLKAAMDIARRYGTVTMSRLPFHIGTKMYTRDEDAFFAEAAQRRAVHASGPGRSASRVICRPPARSHRGPCPGRASARSADGDQRDPGRDLTFTGRRAAGLRGHHRQRHASVRRAGGAIVRYDGKLISVAAARGGAPGSAAATTERFGAPPWPIWGFPPEQTVLTKTMHHVADVNTDPSCSDEFRRHARERGVRSILSMPVLRGGDPVGVIIVSRAQPGAFSTAEVALLQTFADQAVIAIENGQLFKELESRNRDLTESAGATDGNKRDAARHHSSSPTDTQPVFDTIAANAARLCAARDAQVLRVEGEELGLVSAYGSPSIPPVRSISRRYVAGVSLGEISETLGGKTERTARRISTTIYELDGPDAIATPESRAMRGWYPFAPHVRSRRQVIVPVQGRSVS
jgi:GAF domain-containing protein